MNLCKIFSEEDKFMLKFIKSVLFCFLTIEVIDYVYPEDLDIDEEIFYYFYYCENGFLF